MNDLLRGESTVQSPIQLTKVHKEALSSFCVSKARNYYTGTHTVNLRSIVAVGAEDETKPFFRYGVEVSWRLHVSHKAA